MPISSTRVVVFQERSLSIRCLHMKVYGTWPMLPVLRRCAICFQDWQLLLQSYPELTHLSLSLHQNDGAQVAPLLARMSMLKSLDLNSPYQTVVEDLHDRAHDASAPAVSFQVAHAVSLLEEFSLTNVRVQIK